MMRRRKILNQLKHRPGESILDVKCGTLFIFRSRNHYLSYAKTKQNQGEKKKKTTLRKSDTENQDFSMLLALRAMQSSHDLHSKHPDLSLLK